MELRSFKNFLDSAWYCGHVLSTHCVLSQVYSASALNARAVPGCVGATWDPVGETSKSNI
eukprot:2804283-Amphidinium_carterae.1